jgi:hypothetical protein
VESTLPVSGASRATRYTFDPSKTGSGTLPSILKAGALLQADKRKHKATGTRSIFLILFFVKLRLRIKKRGF